MNNVKRLCRVCMANDWNGNLMPIFQDAGNRTASDIFTISGVQVVDFPSCPALICLKCIEDLSRAIIFRNRCKSSDQFLRDTLVNENNHQTCQAQSYDNFEFKNEQDVLNSIKIEPIEIETFFEYPTINAEAILNENSLDDDQDDVILKEELTSANRKKFKCIHCDQLLSSEHALKHHLNAIHGTQQKPEKQFTCEICGKTFVFKSKYTRHFRTVHIELKESNEIIGCQYCMKQFDQRTALKDHIRYKHEVYDFKCDKCGKLFTLKNKLSKHFKESHLKGSKLRKQRIKKEPKEVQCFPCVVCGKICASKTFLKVHEKSHIKIRPEDYYYCDMCGNKFRAKNPLELHIKTRHILKLRYTCDKCPGKSWARKDHMKRHVKVVHENIREFKCEWCGKDFPEKRKLECHRRIHTGEQPYTCNYFGCGKKYTHETDYRRHIWSHTGERKYNCTSCRIAFSKRSELIAHRSECVYYNYNQNNVNI
ncbi:hypothetical protein ACKWTF_009045 [Chironomus riparius]